MTQDQSLRSVFTSNFPDILRQLNISLAVSTYQAGRLILIRYEETGKDQPEHTGVINTHFRFFDKPMGICLKKDRLCIGGTHTVWEYRNVPATVNKLEPPGRHDACYVPRSIHFTGNIDIHEMSWSNDDELWLVNTRFSCLCTLDRDHSFYPRWRPDFVSALAPEDRCHLNGLAMRDGKPRYVTALGETNSRGEWRSNKVNGGILIDIDNGEVMLRGLSMPHSPRWYRDKLWFLESGKGALCQVDLDSHAVKPIASMPGFTRGIDFFGPLAFIGLSKVRETAVFSGLPITKDLTERACGVWVVNIETGETLAFLRFESEVEEIFAVQVLPGMHYPELLPSDAPLVTETYVLPDEALADVELPTPQEVEKTPHFALARGVEHFRKQEYEDAVRTFRECLDLQADFPDARYNLGIVLAETGRWEEALTHLEAAREKEPDRSEIQLSLGSLYQRMGDFENAKAAFEIAIRREPKNANAHMSLAGLLLQLGQYRQGFEEYEWRITGGLVPALNSPHPTWDGTDSPEQILLVYSETNDPRQVILLMRLVPVAATHVKKVIVGCSEELAPLLSSVAGIHDVRALGTIASGEFDIKVSLESLPHRLKLGDVSIPPCTDLIQLDVLQRRSTGDISPEASEELKIGIAYPNSAR